MIPLTYSHQEHGYYYSNEGYTFWLWITSNEEAPCCGRVDRPNGSFISIFDLDKDPDWKSFIVFSGRNLGWKDISEGELLIFRTMRKQLSEQT